jgi:hypothetical protein
MRVSIAGLVAASIVLVTNPMPIRAELPTETGQRASDKESTELAVQREHMKNRPRPIIYNNDGGGIMAAGANTPEGFLAQRMDAVLGSQVGSVFYCTGATTMFTHQAKVGETYGKYAEGMTLKTNIEALDEKYKTDVLALTVQFCHENDLEVFFTHRINDIHDCFLSMELSTWKREHPEYLMGKPEDWQNYPEPDPRRRWAALDFEIPEVRDYIVAIIDDVLARYDLDGIEIDYLRNPLFFRPNRLRQPATPDQVRILTGFQRRIRDLAYAHGNRRGRPILVATRVPVTERMGLYAGIDVRQWLEEDLLDVLTTAVGCMPYTNPTHELVELGHAHGVPVYPTIAGSGRDEHQTVEHWRGAAANFWHAGADGIVFFNLFPTEPGHPMFTQLGNPQKLAGMDKIFALDNMAIYDGGINHTILDPPLPVKLSADKLTCRLTFPVGDDVPDAAKEGRLDSATLRIRFADTQEKAADVIEVRLNGDVLKSTTEDPKSGWVMYATNPTQFRHGDNELSLTLGKLATVAKNIVVGSVELDVKYKEATIKH